MKKIAGFLLIFINLLFLFLLYTQKIDLTIADLGRHLKNGEIILKEGLSSKVLTTNFYSYTLPDQPFINHHWLTGVIFYLIYKNFNFVSLSLFYLFLGLLTWLLILIITKEESNLFLSGFFGLFFLPLFVFRNEIRPEGFTYFFITIFIFLITKVKNKKLNKGFLYLTLPLITLWINLHIGFIFGFLIIFSFLFEQGIRFITKKENDFLFILKIFLLMIIFCCLNPYGPYGLIFPFFIFKNYGYLIVENQGVFFLEKLGFGKTLPLFYFKIILITVIISFLLLFIFRKKDFSIFYFFIVVALSIMSLSAIRHFPVFALLAFPALAKNLNFNFLKYFSKEDRLYFFSLIGFLFLFSLLNLIIIFYQKRHFFGWGLMPKVERSAAFFINNNLNGPIFNNYDIGSYLIFYLFPKEKIFVDNRPEAYTEAFFEHIYKDAQNDFKTWQKLDKKYQFNVVFFSHRDYTPWGQNFLVTMVNKSLFIPIYVDEYNIIFLRNNKENKSLIEKYKIKKERFRIIKNN